VLTYWLQGVRWKLLLSPLGRISALRSTQGIYAGLFTNEVVPLRVGELVRAYLASRWLSASMVAVLPSMMVERFLDALWLATGIGLAAIAVRLPKDLTRVGDVLGILVLAATAVFLWIVLRRERELEHGSARVSATGLKGAIGRLAEGLREIGRGKRFYLAALLSAGMLLCQALALWFLMWACAIRLPLVAAAITMLVVRLGTAVPNAPANVGSFQFFTVLALSLFGIDKTVAAAFSVVDFVVLTAPLWILGLWAISRTGMSLSAIRAEIARLWRSPSQPHRRDTET
jgi:uncharacterized protein (TIRG00374 family)